MKERFPGFFRPDDETFNHIWNDGLIVLDTNVLLHLYRYSESTRQELFKIMEQLRERLWCPDQIALEYLQDRIGVIRQQREAYKALNIDLDQKGNQIEDQTNKLHRDSAQEAKEYIEKVQEGIESLKQYLSEKQENLDNIATRSTSLEEDSIWHRVVEIYNNRVGGSACKEAKERALNEGKKRYESEIPPGFKDKDKPDSGKPGSDRKFGDLIAWFQILDKVKEEKKPFIFVTDDAKEDWFWQDNKQTIGPRPELIEEAKDYAKSDCYIYSASRFMEEASKRFDLGVEEGAITEAERLREEETAFVTVDEGEYSRLGKDTDEAYPTATWQEVERAIQSNPSLGNALRAAKRLDDISKEKEGFEKELQKAEKALGSVDQQKVAKEADRAERILRRLGF